MRGSSPLFALPHKRTTKQEKGGFIMNKINLTWAVCFKIDGKNYDDKKARISTVALFNTPQNAEDFIDKCMPAETKERFFIILTDELEKCDDVDRIQRVAEKYAKVIQ